MQCLWVQVERVNMGITRMSCPNLGKPLFCDTHQPKNGGEAIGRIALKIVSEARWNPKGFASALLAILVGTVISLEVLVGLPWVVWTYLPEHRQWVKAFYALIPLFLLSWGLIQAWYNRQVLIARVRQSFPELGKKVGAVGISLATLLALTVLWRVNRTATMTIMGITTLVTVWAVRDWWGKNPWVRVDFDKWLEKHQDQLWWKILSRWQIVFWTLVLGRALLRLVAEGHGALWPVLGELYLVFFVFNSLSAWFSPYGGAPVTKEQGVRMADQPHWLGFFILIFRWGMIQIPEFLKGIGVIRVSVGILKVLLGLGPLVPLATALLIAWYHNVQLWEDAIILNTKAGLIRAASREVEVSQLANQAMSGIASARTTIIQVSTSLSRADSTVMIIQIAVAVVWIATAWNLWQTKEIRDKIVAIVLVVAGAVVITLWIWVANLEVEFTIWNPRWWGPWLKLSSVYWVLWAAFGWPRIRYLVTDKQMIVCLPTFSPVGITTAVEAADIKVLTVAKVTTYLHGLITDIDPTTALRGQENVRFLFHPRGPDLLTILARQG